MTSRHLTTAAALRQTVAVLRQAATLLETQAHLGGGLTEDTRQALRLAAGEYRAQADFVHAELAVRCARDLDMARARRCATKREAA